jgi:hypothetical protein
MDVISHDPDCTADAEDLVPALVIRFAPSRTAGTIRVTIWEECPGCLCSIVYANGRSPLRRFHREWRASLATWLATWEHRHQIWGRVTSGS